MVALGKVLISAMALVAPIIAQTTPAQVVDNIKMLTQKSQALQAPAQSITIINGPLILVGQGPFPQIIAGFTDIVITATTAVSQMQGMPPVPAGAASDAIFEAFREVSQVHISIALFLTSHLVCSRPPGASQYPDRQSRALQYCTIHWSARRRCASTDRSYRRCQFVPTNPVLQATYTSRSISFLCICQAKERCMLTVITRLLHSP